MLVLAVCLLIHVMISFIKMRKKLVILNFSFLGLLATAVQFNSSKEYPLSNNDHLLMVIEPES